MVHSAKTLHLTNGHLAAGGLTSAFINALDAVQIDKVSTIVGPDRSNQAQLVSAVGGGSSSIFVTPFLVWLSPFLSELLSLITISNASSCVLLLNDAPDDLNYGRCNDNILSEPMLLQLSLFRWSPTRRARLV